MSTRTERPCRWAAVAGLLVLSPVCAEYLVGYNASADKPLELLAGLVILAPLYGTVAVLIREVTRRTCRGWLTILLLSLAFGVIQAGLVDQSLFFSNVDPDSPDWAKAERITIVPGTGVDVAILVSYVGGHVIWSFAAPIAVVESCAPRIATRRWLGPAGIVAMVLLWALAAAAVHNDAAAKSTASTAQLIGAALVSIGLIMAAFTVRPPKGPRSAAQAPRWWLVGAATAAVLFANQLLPMNWLGATLNVVALAALGWLALRWSRRQGWSRGHVLAVAGSALLVRAALSFAVEPLGEVNTTMKLVVNAGTLIGVATLLIVAARRIRRQESSTC
jgi:hypothetical protein